MSDDEPGIVTAPLSDHAGPGLEHDVPLPEPPPLALVRDGPSEEGDRAPMEDPVLEAIARSGVDALASGTDGDVRGVLYRLAEEATQLGPIDRALLHAEAAQRLEAGGIEGAAELVTAALEVGRKASPAPAPARASVRDEGEPDRTPLVRSLAELLEDPDALKPPEAVVPRLAYRGRVTLVAGREKLGGKSTLLTAGAAALTRGADFLGEPCAQGAVLWVTADQEHAREITQRAVRFDAAPDHFHVLWPREPFADLIAALVQLAPVLLLVIDSLAHFAHRLVEKASQSDDWPRVLLPLLQIARERDLAVVLAHHANKAEGGGYRDSTAIGAGVDLLLELHRDGANPGRRNVTAIGRWTTPDFAVDLVGDRYRLVAGGALSLDARILAFAQQHPGCSKLDVRTSIGGRSEDVDVALAQLVARGAVRDTGTERRHAYVSVTIPPAAEDPDAVPF